MKSFEELFEEFKNNEEIKKIGNEVICENKKRKRITWIVCLIIDIIIIFFINKFSHTISFKHGFASIWMSSMTSLIPILMFNLIIILIISMVFSKNKKKFLPVFKEQIITKMIQNFIDDMKYFPNKKMPEKTYNEGKYETYDNYYSDDYIEGRLNGKYLIELAEVETEEEREVRDSDGNTTTETRTLFDRPFCKNDYRKKY